MPRKLWGFQFSRALLAKHQSPSLGLPRGHAAGDATFKLLTRRGLLPLAFKLVRGEWVNLAQTIADLAELALVMARYV